MNFGGARAWVLLVWCSGITVVTSGIVRIRQNWENSHPLESIGLTSTEARELLQSLVGQGGHALLAAACLGILLSGPWRWPASGVMSLIGGGLGCFLAAVAVGGIVGPMPGVTLGQGVWILLLLALVFRASDIPRNILQHMRWMARAFIFANLIAIITIPDLVLQTGYRDSWIPGFTHRFHGLSPHAHQTSALAFLLVLLALDAGPGRWRWADIFLGLGVILYAQSKQFVLILLVTTLVGAVLVPALPTSVPLRRGVLRLGVGLLAIVACLFLLAVPDPVRVIVPEDQSENAETWTGRTLIWAHSVTAWEASPWFGNGPRTWLDDMAERFRHQEGWLVSHAHSQFYQTLAQGGLMGLMGIFLAGAALMVGLWQERYRRPWLVAGLITVLVFRSLVEPLVYMNLIDTGTILVLVAILVVILGRREPHA